MARRKKRKTETPIGDESSDDDESVYRVPTKNQFAPLANKDGDNNNTGDGINNDNKSRAARPKKPPPIVVFDTLSNATAAISAITAEKFKIQLDTNKVRLYACDDSTHELICTNLIAKKIEYFTHQLRENKLKKFVLYGLNKHKPDLLKAELIKQGLKVEDVKAMTLKNPKYVDHTNYIIYFNNKEAINLNNLKEIKHLYNTIIRWDHYRHLDGPTRCSNCQLHGHGGKHCKLSPKCVACGGGHLSKECELLIAKKGANKSKLHQSLLKCANCGGNHTASFTGCPERKRFIVNQQAASARQNKQRPSTIRDVINTQRTTDFPVFPQSQYQPAAQTQPKGRSYSTVVQNEPNSGELYSPIECKEIFLKFFQTLLNCKSKSEQLQAIANFAFDNLINNA